MTTSRTHSRPKQRGQRVRRVPSEVDHSLSDPVLIVFQYRQSILQQLKTSIGVKPRAIEFCPVIEIVPHSADVPKKRLNRLVRRAHIDPYDFSVRVDALSL